MQIGPAHTAGSHAQEHLTRFDLRFRNLADDQGAFANWLRCVKNGSLHRFHCVRIPSAYAGRRTDWTAFRESARSSGNRISDAQDGAWGLANDWVYVRPQPAERPLREPSARDNQIRLSLNRFVAHSVRDNSVDH